MNTPGSPDRFRVCIVDDDASVRKSLANLLRSAGYETLLFESGEDFLASAPARLAGCAVVDLRMPGVTGVEVQRELARRGSRLPVICMSAHWDDALMGESLRYGAVACLGKPFSEEVLIEAVEAAFSDY
ncbi:MAG TPA: response regulator [Pseudomonas sp.]|uniref:response regulator n=1 Tax=Pseudomonas sp. TaxID=306 RepID=UPI002B49D889|nr:response regulator [Pseudomonas sp.]HKS14966.1 response regulator [Pseudomonas sp.]